VRLVPSALAATPCHRRSQVREVTRQPQCKLCASEVHTIVHTRHPCIALPSPTLGVHGQPCARAALTLRCMVCDAVL